AMSVTLKPGADLSRFWLYTIAPLSSLFDPVDFGVPVAAKAMTILPSFNNYTGIATGTGGFTGMQFGWFDTNTPKYIEVNQNSMFYAGFSNTPSTVWFSELGTPELIEPESAIEVRTNDGDRIYATAAYNNQLIVLKQN